MRHYSSIQCRGFTLVEVLVVIGIIALLVGVLLPVLGGMYARARDLQCQSNMRQCVGLVLIYAAENKDQLPYMWYWAHGGGHPEGWGHAVGSSDRDAITWLSVISYLASRNSISDRYTSLGVSVSVKNSAFLRCPEAMQARAHVSTYVGNLLAFNSAARDALQGARRDGPSWRRLVERQTKTTQCLPFTVLIWETAVTARMETTVAPVGGGSIDGERFMTGAVHPQFRYYSPRDPFAQMPPETYGNNKPVRMDSVSGLWYNIDPPGGTFGTTPFPYDGNLRFRHRKNTTCNVAYVDGHVGQFTGRFKRDGRPISHDALRKCFMVKWPSGIGIAPDPSLPH